jgi:hypothetical protein
MAGRVSTTVQPAGLLSAATEGSCAESVSHALK